jgi:hypothetical protein
LVAKVTNDARIAFMRQHGITAATWSPEGVLLDVTLGPEPKPPGDHVPAQKERSVKEVIAGGGSRLVPRYPR